MKPEHNPRQRLQHQVFSFWAGLSVREQRLLGLGAAFVLLVLLWLWGIAPAWQAVQKGPAQEAALAQQLGQVLRAAQSLETWRTQNARVVLTPQAALERVRSDSIRLGLQEHINWPQTAGQTVRVDFAQAPAVPVLQWLEGVQRMATVRVQTIQLEAQTAGVLTGYIEMHIQP